MTWRLAIGFGQVQLVVAHQARVIKAQTPIARGWFQLSDRRVPVDHDSSLTLATTNQDGKALHRNVKVKPLLPLYNNPRRIVVAQIVELGLIFALDCGHSLLFSFPLRLRLFPSRSSQRRQPPD